MVPVVYPLQRITTKWIVFVIKINPLYTMIELFRQCVLYGDLVSAPVLSWKLLLYAAVTSIATLAVGIWIFNKYSDKIVYHL